LIAVDTNVLLRYLLWDDDKEQATKADKLISGSTHVLITDGVLAETLWTLKGKKYKLAKPALIDVINSLFEEPNIGFEDGQVVWRALSDYTQAKPVTVAGKKKEVDFADALVVNKARYCAGEQGRKLGKFYTFDTAVQGIPGTAEP